MLWHERGPIPRAWDFFSFLILFALWHPLIFSCKKVFLFNRIIGSVNMTVYTYTRYQ